MNKFSAMKLWHEVQSAFLAKMEIAAGYEIPLTIGMKGYTSDDQYKTVAQFLHEWATALESSNE